MSHDGERTIDARHRPWTRELGLGEKRKTVPYPIRLSTVDGRASARPGTTQKIKKKSARPRLARDSGVRERCRAVDLTLVS